MVNKSGIGVLERLKRLKEKIGDMPKGSDASRQAEGSRFLKTAEQLPPAETCRNIGNDFPLQDSLCIRCDREDDWWESAKRRVLEQERLARESHDGKLTLEGLKEAQNVQKFLAEEDRARNQEYSRHSSVCSLKI